MNIKHTLNDPKHVIASRICNLRTQANLTQEKMAEALGIALSYYSMLERGERALSLSVAEKLCLYHGVTYDYLYLGKKRSDLDLIHDATPQINYTNRDALLNLILNSTEEDCERYWALVKAALAFRDK